MYKRLIYLGIFCLILSNITSAQNQKNEFVFIEGKVTNIKKGAGDISFFTWQLYVTLDSVRFIENDHFDSIAFVMHCDSVSCDFKEFVGNGFRDEKHINKYLGFIRKGSKVRIKLLKESLIKVQALNSEYNCRLFSIYGIRKIRKFKK